MGIVHKLLSQQEAAGSSVVIYPQALRDQQGYVQLVKDNWTGTITTFTLKVEGRMDESANAPWTRLLVLDQSNANTFGNGGWLLDPISGLETMLSIAMPMLPVMRLTISAAVSVGGETISAWLVE